MAENGKIKKQNGVSEKTLRGMVRDRQIFGEAVRKAQEENRQLGIPNWYSINGVIISDQEIEKKSQKIK